MEAIYYLAFVLVITSAVTRNNHQHHMSNKSPKETFMTFSNIENAQRITNGSGSVIAIMDWCFDLKGKELKKYIYPKSFIEGEEIGKLKPRHGEWMAEIVHIIAPEAKIIPIQTRGQKVSYQKYVSGAIIYAADNGAIAITNSMGPLIYTSEIAEAIDYAESKGTIFIDVHPEIKIAENGQKEYCLCDPRIIHTGIVSVPAYPVEPDSLRNVYTWPYDIEPKFKDGWGYSSGPPVVAGVIALMKSVNPEITPKEIREILYSTSIVRNGFKVLDAEAAVKTALNSALLKQPS
jgi:hypothetical protein